MATKIVTKNSSTAGAAPTATDLVQGELAVNVADKRLYTEDNAGAIVELGTNPYNFTANHNGSAKLATTSTGINVTGTATMDGLTSSTTVKVDHTGALTNAIQLGDHATIGNDTGIYFRTTGVAKLAIPSSGNILFSDTGTASLLNISGNGDISFYEDTGTTAKLFWDASAESLGIGTSSPVMPLDVMANSGANALSLRTRVGDDYSFFTFRSNNGTEDLGGFATHRTAASTSNLLFYTNNGGSAAERMRISSAGNVGIGMSPAKLLDLQATDNLALRFYNGTSFKGGIEIPTTAGDMITGSAVNDLAIRSQTNMLFATGGSTERMRIDSLGNVGIGTSSPVASLTVTDSNDTFPAISGATKAVFASDNSTNYAAGISILSNATGSCAINFGDYDNEDVGKISYYHGDNFMSFDTNGSERMRIESNGNLLVGKSSDTIGTAGAKIGTGGSNFTRASNEVLWINRTGSDGTIVNLAKDGGTVGRIGTSAGLYITGPACGLRFHADGTKIFPTTTTGGGADGTVDLGASSARFDDIYATNGTIQTSDRNEKQDIAELNTAETAVAVACKGLLRKFRWKDSVAEKGDEARTHFGIIAQDLQAAFAAEGLDAGDYAMFISTTWTDEETNEEKTRMGVRYSELLAFIIAAL